ncbi:hypothetical protein [Nocardioides lijunqiniae]|uniref:hypothetical protein n=1 Tax=Nocardioides lijunqiniae TaxID=2760832 RepID=UPI001878789E|nr:hypothetical protein [Nocardioides lijunqiniae]
MRGLSPELGRRAASAGGAVLATGTRVLAAVRPAAKPLHPRGSVAHACLYRHGVQPPLGVEFLDAVSTDEVLVRESRSVGLPDWLPDVHGLAVKVTNPDGSHGDLLFSTTGMGRLTRYALTLSRSQYGRPMTTLLPYRTVAGPVVLAARSSGGSTVEILCAVGDGDWRHVADLRLSYLEAEDQSVSFDPVRNQVPGLEQYGWVRRLRAPSYVTARRSRGEGAVGATGDS